MDDELYYAFNELSRKKIAIKQLLESSDSIKEFYKDSFLLIEATEIFNYKTVHGSFYKAGGSKEEERTPFERELINKYFFTIKSLGDIKDTGDIFSLNLNIYNENNPSNFENSTAVAYFIEKNDGNIPDEEQKEFVRLMSKTFDIGIILPLHYLKKIKENATLQELKLVAACLVLINDKSQISEHSLRAIIQKITIDKFESKICNLLDYLYSISPSVTEHLIQICNETFLSKCFLLINNPNQAIEERAGVLEWYGSTNNDPIFIERAKNLRVDVQINKAKGTIDDSRIYVDPVKCTQWITDNKLNNIMLLFDSARESNELIQFSLNWDKVRNEITIIDQVAAILLNCYEVFCSDNTWGIASYLGRRIRHGTLKGTALIDIKDLAQKEKYKSIFSETSFDDQFNNWLYNYEKCLDQLVDKYLHLQTKNKPDGLISISLNSASKKLSANHMLQDIWSSFVKNDSGLAIPYIIVEYCWRIIAEDLANTNKFLMQMKSRHAVFKYDQGRMDKIKQREIQEFCQELNALTAEKFRIISSWFTKPSIASPSTNLDLLFKAVISEIKEFFTNFTPEIIAPEEKYTLSGGLYFVIYDALYILVYNAAKYGKSDGVLEMNSLVNSSEINISITSEVKSDTDIGDDLNNIYAALEGDCEDALITEGRSGIKKLKRMAQDNYISDVDYKLNSNKITASFAFKIDY